MLVVPTLAAPAQTFQISLANQVCELNIYQKPFGLFMDLFIVGNDTPVVAGVLCENLNRIVRSIYLGFSGDFIFQDTQGTSDPVFDGLGTRYLLQYLEAADLPAEDG